MAAALTPLVLFTLFPALPVRAAPAEATLSLTQVRVGMHAGFTRVVLELSDAAEWSTDLDARGFIRVLIPGARAVPSLGALRPARGLVRSVQAFQRPSGVEVAIACGSGAVEIRHLTLRDPDRIVLDLSLAAPAGRGPDPAGRAASSAAGRGLPPAAPPSPGAGGLPPEAGPAGPAAAPLPAPRPAEAEAQPAATPPTERALTIVLDPGHGGHDTGALGPNGLMEKDVVLDLGLRLGRLLRGRLGARVLMTRTADVFVSLPDRVAFANQARADFLVSLHVNGAGKRGAVGFETFFFSREPSDSDARASAQRENLPLEAAAGESGQDALLRATLADMAVTRDMKESSSLAETVLLALDTLLPVQNRGVKSGPFYVLASAAMPAILVESAFITNPQEERKLRQDGYRQRIAEALFQGISRYKLRYEQRLGRRAPAPAGRGS
ncbi:MAG: N-acetylmuramoyl-L-alanine amidase [Candidatus Methylomirabilales bacterium]